MDRKPDESSITSKLCTLAFVLDQAKRISDEPQVLALGEVLVEDRVGVWVCEKVFSPATLWPVSSLSKYSYIKEGRTYGRDVDAVLVGQLDQFTQGLLLEERERA